jgi:lysozyme family protein
MIGTVADGGIGPNTLKALALYEEEVGGVAEVVKEYQKRRQGYYESLSTFETFGRGWTRRTTETTEAALNMI